MSFTDEDLARLRMLISALIARLEAAEVYMAALENCASCCDLRDQKERWLKAAGK
jgi:hypothetical protein